MLLRRRPDRRRARALARRAWPGGSTAAEPWSSYGRLSSPTVDRRPRRRHRWLLRRACRSVWDLSSRWCLAWDCRRRRRASTTRGRRLASSSSSNPPRPISSGPSKPAATNSAGTPACISPCVGRGSLLAIACLDLQRRHGGTMATQPEHKPNGHPPMADDQASAGRLEPVACDTKGSLCKQACGRAPRDTVCPIGDRRRHG